MKEMGMGRTRLGRFAAVTVPATAMSLGLGYAIISGMVTATVSSAGGFDVGGTSARADGMKLSLNQVKEASSTADSSLANATNQESALVTLQDGYLDGMCLAANQDLPFIGTVGLKLRVPTGTVGVGDLNLNASQVDSAAAVLPSTTIGQSASEIGQTGQAAGNQGGFGLKTNATGAAGDAGATSNVRITNLAATAYELTLAQGLNASSLEIGVHPSAQSC
jgi:Family of unknown function (DUF6230)